LTVYILPAALSRCST